MGLKPSPKLPILDFSKENLKPGTCSWFSARNDVRKALEEYGCFVALYDGFSTDLGKAVFGALQELFDLPTETKMKNKYEQKPLIGYVGQIPKLPLHESMGIDNAMSLEAAKSFTNTMWPDGNDRFCETAYAYAKVAAKLDQMVTKMIFESYGVDKYYESYINSTTYLLRLLRNRAPDSEEPNLGFVTHTDKSFTTILHQNQVNGLEVVTKNGDWINVEFPPSSFVVMAGDALMAWSNDRIQSPSHRVIMRGKVTRYSLGLFSFNNGKIETPEEMVDDEHPLQYKPFEHLGFLHFFSTDEGKKSQCPIKSYCAV